MKEYQVDKTEQEWKEKLNDMEYHVLRDKGTERPYTGEYDKFYEEGTYSCAGCEHELFESEQKYNSGCGWPAFWGELESAEIKQIKDRSHGMARTELVCSKCGGHLGHVFNDGPPPSGIRYCINSASLKFNKKQ
ncbi:MAG: peptide-methionine (R)-S-oxide reductase [Maribacter sp.]|jgi:peptide-methionine (R)-S-oxide reductase